jgi:thymidylate synthase
MPVEFEIRQTPKSAEIQYLSLLNDILVNGSESSDRTGVGTKKVFFRTLQIDLTQGFPLLTTKDVWFKGVKEELLWFIRGERNIRPLVLKGVNIWNEWPLKRYLTENGRGHITAKDRPEQWQAEMKKFVEEIKSSNFFAEKWGDLGPVYGYQWRHWKNPDGSETDQLADVIKTIKENPDSRRMIVTAWNPSDIEEMSKSALPPCHMQYQFQVDRGKLNLAVYQRSVDSFLGLPFNIASYALLNHIVANITGTTPGQLSLALGDTHIYLNHQEQIELQLGRDPKPLPKLVIDQPVTNIDSINGDTIKVEGYDPHPKIYAPIAV